MGRSKYGHYGSISIGYPAENKAPANRYNEAKVHFYKW